MSVTRTTPMPSLPSLWTRLSGPNDTLPMVAGFLSDRRSELQGMSFVSLGEQVVAKTPAPGYTDTSKIPPKERVGVMLIFRESRAFAIAPRGLADKQSEMSK